jgi:hypothetical protein
MDIQNIDTTASWDVTPSVLADTYRRFGQTVCLHLHASVVTSQKIATLMTPAREVQYCHKEHQYTDNAEARSSIDINLSISTTLYQYI